MRWGSCKLVLLTCLFVFGVITAFGDNAAETNDGSFKHGSATDSEAVEREAISVKLDGLSVKEMQIMREQAEKHQFQAEVDRMMKLIINSLYKNKEIFLRELISNASDALDKIRFLALTDKSILVEGEELNIRIRSNKADNTLTISDNGIGMTKDELIKNLGTIAKSGTSEFLDKISKDGLEATTANDLIGQFGVGFYSAFLVADKVTVVSKTHGDDQYVWESDAKSFSITKDPRGNTLTHGTEIILHLKPEAEDYIDINTLKSLVKKYSQFINFPIQIWNSRTETVNEEEIPKDSTTDATVEEEKKAKTVEKTVWDWELLNENKPIWTKKPTDVADKEYDDFYKAISKTQEAPLAKIHFNAEGEVGFKSILFVPKSAPPDLYTRQLESIKENIKLYVRRVFIADNIEDLLPKFLNFIRGIVDSDDLPLNVSREDLQQNKLLKIIKKKLVRKVIEMLSKMPESDYEQFWKEFSVSIKLGVTEDNANKARLAKLLRFKTSRDATGFTSLAQYVDRMPTNQNDIYYITAGSLDEAKNSPFVERMLKKNIEVIYMTEPIDEYMIGNLKDFDGKTLKNVAKEGIQLDQSAAAKETKEAQAKDFEPFLKWLSGVALKDKIEKAVLSDLLTSSPCALVASSYGWSGNMERIMKAQAMQRAEDQSGQFYMTMKKTLDVNPRHPLIKELKSRVASNSDDPRALEMAQLLFDTAVLRSGYSISDSIGFAKRIETVMRKSLDVDLDALPEDIPDDEPIVDSGENVSGSDFKVDEDESSDQDKIHTPKTETVKDEL